jgi:transcriptional regulator with XRE-family HTH domain
MRWSQVSDIKKAVGSGIRSIRKAKGISQEALADGAGVSPSYMGEVERGVRNISLETLEKVSNALGVSPIDILRVSNVEPEGRVHGKSSVLEKHIAFMSMRSAKEIELIQRIAKDILAYVEQ